MPNAELAESTGPFGLAFAQMFNPTIGSIVMALAVMACVGSLLGWQFTLAPTAKDAADDQHVPDGLRQGQRVPARRSSAWSIMGVVQSLMALSTISPNLSEQFAALVNLAVVTNVVPYIIALSALIVHDARRQGRARRVQAQRRRRGGGDALFSVYALWASGKDAVMGGMLVMGIGYIVWGFIAPRFVAAPAAQGVKA